MTCHQQRPEGCYYFWNYADGTQTLWMNSHPVSAGNGAETSDVAKGMLRQPLCAAAGEASQAARTSAQQTCSAATLGVRKVSAGTCADMGWLPIGLQSQCEAAARHLGLADTKAKVTNIVGRPWGCYNYRNSQDLTQTLWMNLNPLSIGKGAGTSEPLQGKYREPVCMQPGSVGAMPSPAALLGAPPAASPTGRLAGADG